MIRALYGGTFDPFHEGHLQVVRTLLQRRLCDHVHVVPAGRSPFKSSSSTSPEQRLAMARVALADEQSVTVDDREVLRPGASWTVVTLAELVAEYPGDEWRLVMGTDAAAGLPRWREAPRLLALARPLILARRGDSVPDWVAEVNAVLVDDFDVLASATDIRRRLAAGHDEDLPLPDVVLEHIRAHSLYGWKSPDRSEPGGPACP